MRSNSRAKKSFFMSYARAPKTYKFRLKSLVNKIFIKLFYFVIRISIPKLYMPYITQLF